MRCEPGVGGRIMEVYDAQSGDGLELARITVWEPGERLSWESSLDDVTIDVRFEPTAPAGRRPARGDSSGGRRRTRRLGVRLRGAAVVRRLDGEARRSAARTSRSCAGSTHPTTRAQPPPRPAGSPTPSASRRRAACRRRRIRSDEVRLPVDRVPRWQRLTRHRPARGPARGSLQVTHEPWVFVDDLEAHLTRARGHGATIVQDIQSHASRRTSRSTSRDVAGASPRPARRSRPRLFRRLGSLGIRLRPVDGPVGMLGRRVERVDLEGPVPVLTTLCHVPGDDHPQSSPTSCTFAGLPSLPPSSTPSPTRSG